jgi:3-phytase
MTEDFRDASADDPAFWVHPTDRSKTLVIVALKNAGMQVLNLSGTLVQDLPAAPEADGEAGRINNVDVIYGLTFPDGTVIDVAVASDRGQDRLRVFRIDGDAAAPLTEITAPDAPRAFAMRPDPAGGADQENPLEDQMTAYGITGWMGADGVAYVAATQRTNPRLGIFALEPREDGTVSNRLVHDVRFPWEFRGQPLMVENDDNPLLDWSPQFEGLVADRTSGIVYAGLEDVGIFAIDTATGEARPEPVYTTRGSSESVFRDETSIVSRDVEGLTIYYGQTARYLLASSQGNAHGDQPSPDVFDDTYAVFEINADGSLTPRGSLLVTGSGAIDGVQGSDGADVIATALPGFEEGLWVVHDEFDNDLLDGEVASSNYKYVSWGDIARAFTPPLEINPGYDPRM